MNTDVTREDFKKDLNLILDLSYKYCKEYDTLGLDFTAIAQQINAKAYKGLKGLKTMSPNVGTECCDSKCKCKD